MRRVSGDGDYSYNNSNNGYHNSGYSAHRSSWSANPEMSLAAYNGLIGIILLYGFGMNVLLVATCAQYFSNINPIALVIGYLVLSITGIIISRKSDNPWVSFLGYNLVVIPIGIVLSVCLQGQSSVTIMNALATTAGVVTIMLIAGSMFPNVFFSIGRVLGLTLLAVIIIEVILAITGIATPTFLDVIVALIFCLYIGYDWARAQEHDHTPDAAVDACVSLYLDIVNVFLRVLSLYSRGRSD